MKKSLFSRFFKNKSSKRQPEKAVATPADLQKKLANYQRVEGPANFTSAAVYFVNEVDEVEPPAANLELNGVKDKEECL
ncbi:MAG: hypothetical protein CMK89_02380 [Pseudomonadales bacterium]|nr:hypothetical protein [Pseudomonadales bacterium]